uniref:Uncharacterized protein n=1 Tax=Catagonus wagneri TaxID=51154 RepID=A0A8C3WQM3_9CETA
VPRWLLEGGGLSLQFTSSGITAIAAEYMGLLFSRLPGNRSWRLLCGWKD